jgi:predicted tellurium resistance membrane protein TerC
MASNSLAKKQRLLSIGIGAGAAVIMRVVLTVFAAKLMGLPYIKLWAAS